MPTWICIDGPYGVQDFNYRRYPVLLLAGGGIGITPVMCMMKDMYDVGILPENQLRKPHAVETVYLMWVMPNLVDYNIFRDNVDLFMNRATQPRYPKLVVMIYITRSKDSLQPPLTAGRPKVSKLFETIMTSHADVSDAVLVFACGPGPMVAELWDNSIHNAVMGRRVDFHHEFFEF